MRVTASLPLSEAKKEDTHQADLLGRTQLFHAAQAGDVAAVAVLIKAGAPVNRADVQGSTPLLVAARHGHTAVVEMLIQAGAAPDQADGDGTTPLLAATRRGYLDVVAALLHGGASIKQASRDGWTPLHTAASHQHYRHDGRVLGILLQSPEIAESINQKTSQKKTALNLAVNSAYSAAHQILTLPPHINLECCSVPCSDNCWRSARESLKELMQLRRDMQIYTQSQKFPTTFPLFKTVIAHVIARGSDEFAAYTLLGSFRPLYTLTKGLLSTLLTYTPGSTDRANRETSINQLGLALNKAYEDYMNGGQMDIIIPALLRTVRAVQGGINKSHYCDKHGAAALATIFTRSRLATGIDRAVRTLLTAYPQYANQPGDPVRCSDGPSLSRSVRLFRTPAPRSPAAEAAAPATLGKTV